MMNPSNDNLNAGHRGFTLLEVLMAAIIISLGVLGITALFAGAARQQQIASEMTRSVIASKNAEAIIGPTIGAISASQANILTDHYPPFQWVPLFMHQDRYYLTTADDEIFFLVRPSIGFPVKAYDIRNVPLTGNPPNPAPLRGLNSHNSMRQYLRYFADLPHRRIDPFSVSEIRVTVKTEPGAAATVFSYRLPGRVRYDDDTWGNVDGGGDALGDIWRFPRNGDTMNANTDFIDLNCRISSTGTGPFASIGKFQIAGVDSSRYIESIEVVDYRWRSDRLISLRDRLVTPPGATQPTMGYAAMYRRTGDATSQLALITYSLTSRIPGAVYVPPERAGDLPDADNDGNGNGLIRRIGNITLRFDENVGQYYIVWMGGSGETVDPTAPGQVLFFEADLDLDGDGTEERDVGADFEVRVTRRQRIGGEQRAYLDAAPRAGGVAMLDDRTGSLGARVFVLAERVISLEDGSEWILKPLEVRVFQLQ